MTDREKWEHMVRAAKLDAANNSATHSSSFNTPAILYAARRLERAEDKIESLERLNLSQAKQLNYYIDTFTMPSLAKMWAVYGADPVPAIEPERVVNIVEERDRLRSFLEANGQLKAFEAWAERKGGGK